MSALLIIADAVLIMAAFGLICWLWLRQIDRHSDLHGDA